MLSHNYLDHESTLIVEEVERILGDRACVWLWTRSTEQSIVQAQCHITSWIKL